MICERCGYSMLDGSLTCEHCGTFLGNCSGHAFSETGVRAIRQGRVSATAPTLPSHGSRMREYGDYELSAMPVEQEERAHRRKPITPKETEKGSASRPNIRRGVPVNARGRSTTAARKRGHKYVAKRSNINWMLIGLVITVIGMISFAGYMVYMSKSDGGQRATARKNTLEVTEGMFALARNTKDPLVQKEHDVLLKEWNKVPAQVYWLVGQEYVDVGDVETAILSFRIADVVDPENYDGLLQLAGAYELNGEDKLAEDIYLNLAKTVSPFRSEAYTMLIRMYGEQGRNPESADMMLLAYQNTDKETFRLQRKDFIPLSPQTDLAAGRHEMEQKVHLTSPQGYDIYYTTDDEAILPKDGTLLTDGIVIIKEGTLTLRAICVSDDLVSDPMEVSYTVFYPSPPAPKANLGPNTYKSLKEVKLRAGEGTLKTDTLTFYYTIDGSMPSEDSPIYDDDTPIKLPAGRVTLRAICVNQYGKMSSTMEVGYKFEAKPYLMEEYKEEDTFSGFVLNKTSITDFIKSFGNPVSDVATVYLNMTNEARHLEYKWGYAVFILDANAWKLVRIEMNSQIASGPRGISFGSSENEVIAAFKDFGQPAGKSGNRSLYYAYPQIGELIVGANGSRVVKYSLGTKENKLWYLEYHIKGAHVNQILHYYQP